MKIGKILVKKLFLKHLKKMKIFNDNKDIIQIIILIIIIIIVFLDYYHEAMKSPIMMMMMMASIQILIKTNEENQKKICCCCFLNSNFHINQQAKTKKNIEKNLPTNLFIFTLESTEKRKKNSRSKINNNNNLNNQTYHDPSNFERNEKIKISLSLSLAWLSRDRFWFDFLLYYGQKIK